MVGDVVMVGSRGHAPARRVVSLLVGIALLATMLLLVADKAEAAPAAGPAAALVVSGGDSAQFSIPAIVCPILLFLRAAFGPFFSGIFDSLLAAFGCINVSPGGSIPDDDDDD